MKNSERKGRPDGKERLTVSHADLAATVIYHRWRVQRNSRIDGVVNRFLDLWVNRRARDSRYLLDAGISILHSKAEVRECLSRLKKRRKQPFKPEQEKAVERVDLLRFFQIASEENIPIHKQEEFDKLVARLQGKTVESEGART